MVKGGREVKREAWASYLHTHVGRAHFVRSKIPRCDESVNALKGHLREYIREGGTLGVGLSGHRTRIDGAGSCPK